MAVPGNQSASMKFDDHLWGEILAYLSPPRIVYTLRATCNSPKVQGSVGSWNVALFTLEQLIHIYQWNNETLDIGLADIDNPPINPRPMIDAESKIKLRECILRELSVGMRKYLRTIKTQGQPVLLALDSFNVHYHRVKRLFTDIEVTNEDDAEVINKDGIATFIKEFHRKNRAIQAFCEKLIELDTTGMRRRGEKIRRSVETQNSMLLFWHAMEYICIPRHASDTGTALTEDTINQRWTRFHKHLVSIFGAEGSRLLHRIIAPEGVVCFAYDEIIYACSENFLPQIRRNLVTMDGPSVSTYAIFVLSYGFDRALLFLNEDAGVIQDLRNARRSDVDAWKNVWEWFNTGSNIGVNTN